ncbi:MAG: hypothetical protein MZV70_62575 [Desulfobacterales bacterium]|nr:hypothetical protein [Desulfobacterales bacterium]
MVADEETAAVRAHGATAGFLADLDGGGGDFVVGCVYLRHGATDFSFATYAKGAAGARGKAASRTAPRIKNLIPCLLERARACAR